MTFVSGMNVDSSGKLSTLYLGTDPVPAGAAFLNGFAFSAEGSLYVCDWPADGQVYYERGVARRADGAVCAVEAAPDLTYMGWGLTSRGELCLAPSGLTSYYDEGVGVEASGKVVVSDGVGA